MLYHFHHYNTINNSIFKHTLHTNKNIGIKYLINAIKRNITLY